MESKNRNSGTEDIEYLKKKKELNAFIYLFNGIPTNSIETY